MASKDSGTYSGDAKAFAEAVLPLAQKKGRLWCKYPCEEQRLEKAVLDIKSVYAHHELLMILQNLQANLSFPQNVVHLGLHILVQQCDDVFKLREDQVDDYITSTTRRLRCLGRVVSQGQHKRVVSLGAKDLPWLAACKR